MSETFASIAAETGAALGIPASAYTEPAAFSNDIDQVLGPTWVAVALSNDVASAGDVVPVMVGSIPLVIVRNREGVVRAFHNVCSHRGIVLVETPQSGRSVLLCPYHAWTYDLDGRLRRTPNIGGPGKHEDPNFNPAGLGLRAVACDEWAGVIFVNLSNTAPPLRQHLRPLIDRWSHIDLTTATHGGGLRFDLRANWKLGCENFVERYHLPSVHPALSGYSNVTGTYAILADPLFVGVGATAYTKPAVDGPSLPEFPKNSDQPVAAEYVAVFPNLLLGCHADHFYAFLLLPRGPEHTEERFEFFFPGASATSAEYSHARDALIERRRVTNLEDIAIVERLQRGMHSPAFRGARFSPFFEETTLRFQRTYRAALSTGARPSSDQLRTMS